jgi:hypothetical protein
MGEPGEACFVLWLLEPVGLSLTLHSLRPGLECMSTTRRYKPVSRRMGVVRSECVSRMCFRCRETFKISGDYQALVGKCVVRIQLVPVLEV